MYRDEYDRRCKAELVGFDLKRELTEIAGDEDAIRERSAASLSFGTAGLRGTLGVGANRMSIWVVRQATQGIVDWVETKGGSQTVAISYDSRLKGWNFARDAASAFATNGIRVRLYDELMSVPALSSATRYYNCNAGIMIVASHNPAKYNGYKVYGVDGCQITDEDAAVVYAAIQKTDVLSSAKFTSFAESAEKGLIRLVGDDYKEAFYAAIGSRQVRPGICKTTGLRFVYSPLNGTGPVPVTRVLKDIGVEDVMIVKEQEHLNGYFTTCPCPNPEILEAPVKGLAPTRETGADLMFAMDPDVDRVGIAMRIPDGEYELVSGNEIGVSLLDYTAAGGKEAGTMPERSAAVKSVVSTQLTDKVVEYYDVELHSVLTGFRWIGDQTHRLGSKNEAECFILGFEESYGHLAGTYIRDKDAVVASVLICEMAAYYRSIGSPIKAYLEEIYETHGHYLNAVDSFESPGLSGMEKTNGAMETLRKDPLEEPAGYAVTKVTDFEQAETTGLPRINIPLLAPKNGETVIVRPSGIEPKIKTYSTTKGEDMDEAKKEKEEPVAAIKPLLAWRKGSYGKRSLTLYSR